MHELIYLERNGAIYRGYRPDAPMELWDEAMQIWQPYAPVGPIPIDWAREVSSEEALIFMKPDTLSKMDPPRDP